MKGVAEAQAVADFLGQQFRSQEEIDGAIDLKPEEMLIRSRVGKTLKDATQCFGSDSQIFGRSFRGGESFVILVEKTPWLLNRTPAPWRFRDEKYTRRIREAFGKGAEDNSGRWPRRILNADFLP